MINQKNTIYIFLQSVHYNGDLYIRTQYKPEIKFCVRAFVFILTTKIILYDPPLAILSPLVV